MRPTANGVGARRQGHPSMHVNRTGRAGRREESLDIFVFLLRGCCCDDIPNVWLVAASHRSKDPPACSGHTSPLSVELGGGTPPGRLEAEERRQRPAG